MSDIAPRTEGGVASDSRIVTFTVKVGATTASPRLLDLGLSVPIFRPSTAFTVKVQLQQCVAHGSDVDEQWSASSFEYSLSDACIAAIFCITLISYIISNVVTVRFHGESARDAMEAKIITVFNQKGGCCKTMTAMQLGGTLGAAGYRVFIVDMDPQNTASLWYQEALEEPFPASVLSLAPQREAFLEKLGAIIKKNDIVIVDCPPAIGSSVPWASLLASDLAIIPVIPVMDNVWASRQAEEMALEAAKRNPALQSVYLLSMVRRGKVFDQCHEELRKRTSIPILESRVSMRNAYPESQIYGCIVSSFGKSPAAEEMSAVAGEVAGILNLPYPRGE